MDPLSQINPQTLGIAGAAGLGLIGWMVGLGTSGSNPAKASISAGIAAAGVFAVVYFGTRATGVIDNQTLIFGLAGGAAFFGGAIVEALINGSS